MTKRLFFLVMSFLFLSYTAIGIVNLHAQESPSFAQYDDDDDDDTDIEIENDNDDDDDDDDVEIENEPKQETKIEIEDETERKTTTDSSWIGFGIHGGVLSDYKNLTLEQSIRDAFGDVADFDFEGEMTDIGVHVDYNSMKFIGFDVSLDYAWKERSIISGYDLRYSVLGLSSSLKASIPFVLSPYAGVGLGGFYTATSLNADTFDVVLPDDKVNFGWLLKAGLGLDVFDFPLLPFVEWRYTNIRTSDEPVKYHSLLLGVTFKSHRRN